MFGLGILDGFRKRWFGQVTGRRDTASDAADALARSVDSAGIGGGIPRGSFGTRSPPSRSTILGGADSKSIE